MKYYIYYYEKFLIFVILLFLLSSCSTITEQIVAKNCRPFVDSKEYYLCDKVDE